MIKEKDVNKRIYKAVDLFLRKIEVLAQRDPRPDVIICALPKKIDESFTVSGDSLVLKGEKAEIDKEDRQPHLNENDAKKLLKDAIKTYEEHVGHKPTRVVVHKTSRYTPEEISGFENAVNDAELTLVAFGNRVSGIRAFRIGAYPPIRGTFIRFNDLSLLYTTGYVPYLGTYPGPKIPTPLEILEVHGDEDIIRVAKEILALTKLNWNSTKFFSRDPITIKFAREVGKILSELPEKYPIHPHYRFYM